MDSDSTKWVAMYLLGCLVHLCLEFSVCVFVWSEIMLTLGAHLDLVEGRIHWIVN